MLCSFKSGYLANKVLAFCFSHARNGSRKSKLSDITALSHISIAPNPSAVLKFNTPLTSMGRPSVTAPTPASSLTELSETLLAANGP